MFALTKKIGVIFIFFSSTLMLIGLGKPVNQVVYASPLTNLRYLTGIGANENVMMHQLTTTMNEARARGIVRIADLSTCTRTPHTPGANCDGLIEPGDVVVVTNKMVIWLDYTTGGPVGNGGGGLARGIWTLKCCDSGGEITFKNTWGNAAWPPNELLPGSDGGVALPGYSSSVLGSGISILFRLRNNVDVANDPFIMNVEGVNDQELLKPFNGEAIVPPDGVLYQTQGDLVHVQRNLSLLQGVDSQGQSYHYGSIKDTNPNPGEIVHVFFTLSYQFFPDTPYFRQYLTLDVMGNNNLKTDKIGTFVTSAGTLGPQLRTTQWEWSPNYTNANTYRLIGAAPGNTTCSNGTQLKPPESAYQLAPCTSTPEFSRWIRSTGVGIPNNTWYSIYALNYPGSTFRRLEVRPMTGSFQPPRHIITILDHHSAAGAGRDVTALDVVYIDINFEQNIGWLVGTRYATGIEYHTNSCSSQAGSCYPN